MKKHIQRHSEDTKNDEKHMRKSIDYLLLVIVAMLSLFGIVMVFDSSLTLQANEFHFVIFQTLWVLIGAVAMIFLSLYDYHRLAKLSLPILLCVIILLIIVLFVGNDINGAVRWINLGPIELQPSEMAKPAFILYLAAWFSKEKPLFHSFSHALRWNIVNELLPFVFLTLFLVGLVLLGKDLGTAIVIGATALGMYFIQGTGFLSIISSLASIGIFALGALSAIITEPYRLKRLLNFSGSASDPLGSGYQIKQILIAIGSGGLLGKGFTQSIQKQQYLVQTTAATDSIFAVIAEEFGFVGSTILLFGYLFLFFRCIHIALHAPDDLGKLMVIGIVILGYYPDIA